jgi:hypothetical protein
MTDLPPDFFDDVDPDPDAADGDAPEFDCHMRPDGQCGMAGSEDCDWHCPVMRGIQACQRRKKGSHGTV